MYKNKRILALIPARGGSKGLTRKNLRVLMGKPLVAWTIGAAKNSKYIDRVIVSTDDKEIARISRWYKVEVPFLRPKALATDKASMMAVITHALKAMNKNGDYYDLIVLLQPTSPLRKPEDIDQAIRVLFSKRAKSVVSVCEEIRHPYAAIRLTRAGRLGSSLNAAAVNKNRQELPVFYRINGAIYLAYREDIEKGDTFFGKKTYAYIMPAARSVDIDNMFDFEFARFLLNKKPE